MTRAFTPENAVKFLKEKVIVLGEKITHTQVQDAVAVIYGYNAWSHLQATRRKTKSKPSKAKLGLKEVLIAHYGPHGSVPSLPRKDWRERFGTYAEMGYWDWVIAKVKSDSDLDCLDVGYAVTPTGVTLANQSKSTWMIEQNLTDRWGELNDYELETKSGYAILALNEDFHETLQALMSDEFTFITRKDNRFGVLIEVEFCSKESESGNGTESLKSFKPHAEVKGMLLDGLVKLQLEYPDVEFAYPDESNIIDDRPAVWAFVPMDTLDPTEMSQLCQKMYRL